MKRFDNTNSRIQKSDIVIFIRFSHIQESHNAFRKGKGKELEERIEMVLSEDRLKSRFDYFENVCLPALDAQTDQNFIVVLRCSDLLPQKWKDRLFELVEKRKNIYTAFLSVSERPYPFEKSLLRENLLSDEADTIITARLDDDDALAVDYIEKLRGYLHPQFKNHGITFASGYYMGTYGSDKDKRFKLVPTRKINGSAGQAYISDRRVPRHYILSFPVVHLLLDTLTPVIVDSQKPMFILTAHETNDTNRSQWKDMIEAKFVSKDELIEQLGDGLSNIHFDQIPGQ